MAQPTDPFQPRNDLERALVAATSDPALRGPFLRALLDASVFVVGDPSAQSDGGAPPLKWGSLPDGRPCIPFYSSREWLAGVVDRDVPILELPVRELFAGTEGATLALNLGAPWAKEFTPDEVASLLGATGGGPGGAGGGSGAGAGAIALTVPEDEPVAFIAAVTTVFARHPEVRAAYLGRLEIVGGEQPPRLIVGVEGEGDLMEALQDASAAWDPGDDPESLADFVRIEDGTNPLAAWLTGQGLAFYRAEG
jgi:hypothetical protein